MEFFVCPCPGIGKVLLDDKDQDLNKDDSGTLLKKQCNEGFHKVALECSIGRKCSPIEVVIKDSDPIFPQEVTFQCEI